MTINALILNSNPYIEYNLKNDQSNNHPLNHRLRHLWSQGYKTQIFKEYVAYQFNFIFDPAYFGNICWAPFIFEFDEIRLEAKHFRNKLLTAIHDCKLYQVPELPDRPRIIFFHEVKEVLVNPRSSSPKFKKTLHTHFHLEGSDLIHDVQHLSRLIQSRVRQGFDRIQRPDTELHKAIVVKDWSRRFHLHYNVKDFYSRRDAQDGDLVIDDKNSDLG
jgi:hypothetical protein